MTSQGDRLCLRMKGPKNRGATTTAPTPTRGAIQQFSRKSRKRLMNYLATLDIPEGGSTFITLTYADVWGDPQRVKADLKAFIQAIRRRSPQASGFWRLEFQKRGAPHFHLMLFNLDFWHYEELQATWGRIIGTERPFTDIQHVKSKRGAYRYMSKYVAKAPTDVSLTTGHNSTDWGRHWGVINKDAMPLADENRLVVEFQDGNVALWVFSTMCKAMKMDFEHIILGTPVLSVSAFASDGSRWLETLRRWLDDFWHTGWVSEVAQGALNKIRTLFTRLQ